MFCLPTLLIRSARLLTLAVALGAGVLSARANEAVSNGQSALVLNQIISHRGTFNGAMALFAGDYAPAGTFFANGGHPDPWTTGSQALYDIIGTTYGGTGYDDYQLPNFNGRVAIGQGHGPGLTDRPLGSTAGIRQNTLTSAHMPTSVGGLGQSYSNIQPSLTVNYAIATVGYQPGARQPEDGAGGLGLPYLGQIMAFSGHDMPDGFVSAQGQILNIADNPDLYSAIGNLYGGNGTSTFALPDLRGRAILGAGNGHNVGDVVGSETTTLDTANLPAPYGSGAPVNNQQPALTLYYAMCLFGDFPGRDDEYASMDSYAPLLGQIVAFSSDIIPDGWVLCDGRLLPIDSEHAALFALLGTTYGGSFDDHTFALPDLTGRIALGVGDGHALGDVVNGDHYALTEDQMPETVPEPSTWMLLGVGLLTAVFVARRRLV